MWTNNLTKRPDSFGSRLYFVLRHIQSNLNIHELTYGLCMHPFNSASIPRIPRHAIISFTQPAAPCAHRVPCPVCAVSCVPCPLCALSTRPAIHRTHSISTPIGHCIPLNRRFIAQKDSHSIFNDLFLFRLFGMYQSGYSFTLCY